MHIHNGMTATGGSTISNSTNHGGNIGPPWPAPPPRRSPRSADVAVLTVLDEEIRAVQTALQHMCDYRQLRLRHGPLAREAWLPASDGRRIRLVAVQTLTRGTESAALAYRELVEAYTPSIVLLVGVAGGVSPRVGIGDVVISDEVIAYDARRVTVEGVHRRGQAQTVAGPLGHRLNDFFATTPAHQRRSAGDDFYIHRGPIGSGNAVVTDADADIRRWLQAFNEKVLAVETEAAGVAQSFHESVGRDSPRGWLTIRGISDSADQHKGHDYHGVAAWHAAEVMAMLVPHLHFDES
jgi:adenosylhomocysteine nucleosidase